MEATVNGGFDSFGRLRTGKLAAGKADAWRKRIDDQRASGLSIRAWCAANDVHEHCFYSWRSRLGLSPGKRRPRRPLNSAQATSTPLGFAQVVVNHPVAEPLRLRLAGQTRGEACVRELILPASMPMEQVARLVRALEATA